MRGRGPLQGLVHRYRQGLLTFLLLLVSALMILFQGTPGVSQPQQIGLMIFSTLEGTITGVFSGIGNVIQNWGELVVAKQKLDADEAKLKALAGVEREVVSLQDENARLKAQLNFKTSTPYTLLPAQIIAKDPSRVYSSFTINLGYLQGIKKDQPVIAYQNNIYGLVGKIQMAGLTTSVVQPILDGNMYVAARFQNSRFEGLVSGKGSNEEALKMSYVEKNAAEAVHLGDLVVTSGLDSLYPEGLLIGRVHSISAKEYETSLNIDLEPVISFSQLEYVDVIQRAP